MNLHTLTIEGFRAFGPAVSIDFRATPYAAVVGPNGGGKSAVLEAIEWALYGTSRSALADGVVRIGAKGARVDLTFAVDGKRWRVVRTRAARTATTSGSLDLFREDATAPTGWAAESGSKVGETQARLDAVHGISRQAMLAAAMIKQGEHGAFIRATPAQRRNLLHDMLNLGTWEEAGRNALNKSRMAMVAVLQERDQVSLLSDLADLKAKAEATPTHEAEIARIDKAIATLDADMEKARIGREETSARVGALREEIGGLKAVADAVDTAEREAQNAARALRRAEQERTDAMDGEREARRLAKLAEAEPELRLQLEEARAAQDADLANRQRKITLRHRYATLNGALHAAVAAQGVAETAAQNGAEAPCRASCNWVWELGGNRDDKVPPTLGYEINLAAECPLLAESNKAQGEADKRRAEADTIKAEMARIEAEIATIPETTAAVGLDAHWERLTAAQTAARLLESCGGIGATVARAEAADAFLPEFAIAYEGAKYKLEKAREAAGVLETKRAELEAAQRELDARDRWLNGDAPRLKMIHASDRASAVANREECKRAAVEHAELADRIAKSEAEQARWRTVAEVCRTAPTLMIEAIAVPAMEHTVNEVLAQISRGMRVRMETQVPKASGDGQKETIAIFMRDEAGERPVEDFSGGEQFRVAVAFALAQARLLGGSDRAPDFLFLDEGWGALDADGVASLAEVIAGLTRIYGVVWIVTHLPEAADCLPARVEVVKGPNGSTLEVK